MSERKHTPSPWERLTFSNHEIQTDFAMVKVGGRVHMIGYSAEDFANAQLIAAAPELLEALKELVKANEDHNEAVSKVIGELPGWKDSYLDKARAAIAKATGESK